MRAAPQSSSFPPAIVDIDGWLRDPTFVYRKFMTANSRLVRSQRNLLLSETMFERLVDSPLLGLRRPSPLPKRLELSASFFPSAVARRSVSKESGTRFGGRSCVG